MWPRWVSVFVGGWLAMSAWILQEPVPARWIQFATGAAIFLVAIVAMGMVGARRLNTLLGLGAAVTPFVLGMQQPAAGVNLLACGLVALVASLVPWNPRDHRIAPASTPASARSRRGPMHSFRVR
ncbi:MAG: hypothetical protein WB493_02795 [Anaeromyxobacteraceae bacterium]